MRLTREGLRRIRHRHFGYRITLVVEMVLLFLLPAAQQVPWLLSAMLCLLAVVLVAVVRGDSQFPGLPLLVQIHLASMIIIMMITVPMLLGPKGTARHRLLGRIWAALMLGNALLTLCFNAGSRQLGGVFVGDFSPIHAISLFVAISVPQAVLKARRHDRAGHDGNIRGLVIGSLLVAGLFTLPFGRTLGEWLMGR